MRVITVEVDGARQGKPYPTMHAALADVRVAPRGAKILANGDVLATSMAGAWELRQPGISQLCEEFISPVYAKERSA